MPPIRPFSAQTPVSATKPVAPEATRAAQRAFFQAALGTAAPQPAKAVAVAAPTAPAPAPAVRQPQLNATPDTAPDRIPRPGSLVDIRV